MVHLFSETNRYLNKITWYHYFLAANLRLGHRMYAFFLVRTIQHADKCKKHTRKRDFFLRLHKTLFIYLFFTRECQTQKYAPHEHIHAREQQSFTVVVVAVLPGFFFLIQCNISRCLFVFAEAVWCKVWLGFFVIFFRLLWLTFFPPLFLLYFWSLITKFQKTIHGIGKTKILIYYCLSTQMHKHTHSHTCTYALNHIQNFSSVSVFANSKREKNPVSADRSRKSANYTKSN